MKASTTGRLDGGGMQRDSKKNEHKVCYEKKKLALLLLFLSFLFVRYYCDLKAL